MDTELLIAKIIDASFKVHTNLLPGYLESVYRNALQIELSSQGLSSQIEVPLNVTYRNNIVGEFRADMVVEDKVIVELKSVLQLNLQHELQLVNYLVTTGINDGLLINFGSDKLQVKRKYRLYKGSKNT